MARKYPESSHRSVWKMRKHRPTWKSTNVDLETSKRIARYWSRGFSVESKKGSSVRTIQTQLEQEGIYLDADTIRAVIAELMVCPPSLVDELDSVTRECLVALRPDLEKDESGTSLMLETATAGATVEVVVDPDVLGAAEKTLCDMGERGLGINLEGWVDMPQGSKIIVTVPLGFLEERRAKFKGLPSSAVLPKDLDLQLAAVSYLFELRNQEVQKRAGRTESSLGVKALVKAARELRKKLRE